MLQQHRLGIAALALAYFASAAPAQTTLRYQFKEGDDLQYVVEQKMKMTMSVMGMDIETKMNMTMQLSWNVVKVDTSGNAQLKLRITHAKMSMEGITGNVNVDSNDKEPPDDQIGKIMFGVIKATGSMEMTGTMLPTGEMKDGKMSEATLKALKEVPGADKAGLSPDSFKTMVNSVILPTEAVMKGKAWTHKSDATTQFGKTTTENTYTYDGADKTKLEKISVKPKISIEANPDAPAKIAIKSAKGNGTVLFDNKAGRIQEVTSQQTTQMSISTMGIDLDQTIEQTTTMKLKAKK